jgi:hypothetical protein
MEDEMSKNQPAKRFRCGYLSATVWQNESVNGDGKWFTVDLTRAYKNADGEISHTTSLNADDLENARYLLRKANDWIQAQ